MKNSLDNSALSSLQDVAKLAKSGDSSSALNGLRELLRRDRLTAEEHDRAGKLIAKLHAPPTDSTSAIRVLILGNCTTTWISTTLTAVGWARGATVQVREGKYDSVMQELMDDDENHAAPNAVIFLPWTQRLLSTQGSLSAKERIDNEIAFWSRASELARKRWQAKILQVSYDWVTPGALGHHLGAGADGDIGIVREVNRALRASLSSDAFFLDLEQVSGELGRRNFYDPRRYFWTKQPFSETGTLHLAGHLWAGIRALHSGPKKVLVVDLDNTLWGGIVGETGPLGISLGESADGEAFRAFQSHLKQLSQRGVVLAVCTKNNRDDALAPFSQNPQMVLTSSDIAHFEASWEPKETGIRRIAESLNLGLDSFVFFDDNPAEREHIRQAIPEVEVVEVPPDPADYVRALQAGLWFESSTVLDADRQRTTQYRQESERRESQSRFASIGEYLSSLEMVGDIRDIDQTNLMRVTQLVGKTNQFNLTTRRHSEQEIRKLHQRKGALGITLTLRDRFGDHGLISVILAVPTPKVSQKSLTIETWLMSCRVIGRTAEEFLFNELVKRAKALGYQTLLGCYLPTKANGLVANLYDKLGFERAGDQPEGGILYRLPLSAASTATTFVRTMESEHARAVG